MDNNPYTNKNALHNAIHYLYGRGASAVAGFIVVLLLVRHMDVHNYAAYTALSGLVVMCEVLAGLGMDRVISRYIPEGRMHRTVMELGRFIFITTVTRLIAVLLIVFVLYIFWAEVDRFLAVKNFMSFSPALACLIVAESLFQHFSAVLQALVMQKTLTRLMIIQWAGRLLLLGITITLNLAIDWEHALWVFAIPDFCGVLGFVVVIIWHLYKLRVSANSSTVSGTWPDWGKVAGVGLHNYGYLILAAPPQGYFMKMLTAAFLPVEIVAAYGFFISVAEKIRQYMPLNFFYGLLEPMMIARYLKDGDFLALTHRCHLLYKSNLLFMAPIIAWIAVAGDAIVGLMTNHKFEGLSWILVLVLVQFTSGSHVVLLQLILNTLEKSRLLMAATLVALPVMLTGMFLSTITKPICLLGMPIMFSLTMNATVIYYLFRINRPYKPAWSMLWGTFLSAITAFVVLKAFRILIPYSFSALVIALATFVGGAVIYLLMLWITKAIDKSDVLYFKTIISNSKST